MISILYFYREFSLFWYKFTLLSPSLDWATSVIACLYLFDILFFFISVTFLLARDYCTRIYYFFSYEYPLLIPSLNLIFIFSLVYYPKLFEVITKCQNFTVIQNHYSFISFPFKIFRVIFYFLNFFKILKYFESNCSFLFRK